MLGWVQYVGRRLRFDLAFERLNTLLFAIFVYCIVYLLSNLSGIILEHISKRAFHKVKSINQ